MNVNNKGKNFERQAAKILKKHSGVEWYRVPNSGGLSLSTGEERMFGDLHSKKHDSIVVECKTCKKFSINDLYSNKGKLNKWVLQARTQAYNAERQTRKQKEWLLLFKVNNLGVYACTPNSEILDLLNLKGQAILKDHVWIVKVKT